MFGSENLKQARRRAVRDYETGGPSSSRLNGGGRRRLKRITLPISLDTPRTSKSVPLDYGFHVHPSTSISVSPKAKDWIRRVVEVVDDKGKRMGWGDSDFPHISDSVSYLLL